MTGKGTTLVVPYIREHTRLQPLRFAVKIAKSHEPRRIETHGKYLG